MKISTFGVYLFLFSVDQWSSCSHYLIISLSMHPWQLDKSLTHKNTCGLSNSCGFVLWFLIAQFLALEKETLKGIFVHKNINQYSLPLGRSCRIWENPLSYSAMPCRRQNHYSFVWEKAVPVQWKQPGRKQQSSSTRTPGSYFSNNTKKTVWKELLPSSGIILPSLRWSRGEVALAITQAELLLVASACGFMAHGFLSDPAETWKQKNFH